MKLCIVPIFKEEAYAYIEQNHRHHKPPVGCIQSIAVAAEDKIVGVALIGRPTSRKQQDGFTAEVTRLCTDGTPNACSMLYSACWRVARELGYRRLITYILNSEPGTSLYASNWRLIGERRGGSWNQPSRPRVDKHPTQNKLLFEIT